MADPELPYGLFPDSRMALFIAGFNQTGEPVPLTPDLLREQAATWETSPGTPVEVAGILKTSRDLYIHSYFAYEFLTVGALVSLQAVELALRRRLDSKKRFIDLVERAHSEAVIDDEQYELLEAGRKLRNTFSHPEQQSVMPFGMVAPMVRTSHIVVARVFP